MRFHCLLIRSVFSHHGYFHRNDHLDRYPRLHVAGMRHIVLCMRDRRLLFLLLLRVCGILEAVLESTVVSK